MSMNHLQPDRSAARRPWVEVTLITGFLLSLLIGLAALAALLYARTLTRPTLDGDLLQSFAPDKVVPTLALRELAGDPANALAYQALNAGELATAHALLLFDTTTTGPARAGLWTSLGRAYVSAQQHERAGRLLAGAEAIAVLDSAVPPAQRAQTLIQAAQLYLAAGFPDAAHEATRQAKLFGERLPQLLPVQRGEIFAALEEIAAALDDQSLATQLHELARNPFLSPQGRLLQPQLAALVEPLSEEPALVDAIAVRKESAQALAARIAFSQGQDVGQELQALATALRNEDQLRNTFFQRMRSPASTLTAGQQLALLLDHRQWQAVKLRIGLGGYGISLVPEWEGNVAVIRDDLSRMVTFVDPILTELARQAVEPAAQSEISVDALSWLALQYELALFPEGDPVSLSDRLQTAQNAAAGSGGALALPVAYQSATTPARFRIQ